MPEPMARTHTCLRNGVIMSDTICQTIKKGDDLFDDFHYPSEEPAEATAAPLPAVASADAAAPKRSAICHKSFAIAPAADPAPRRTPEKTAFFYRILRRRPRQTARYEAWWIVKIL